MAYCMNKLLTYLHNACLLMLMIWTGFDELNCAAYSNEKSIFSSIYLSF